MGDSQFIIEFLSKKYNVNFSSNFSPVENGIARAFTKMTEESLFWWVHLPASLRAILLLVLTSFADIRIFELDTFVLNPSPKDIGFPAILLKLAKSRIQKKAKNQGYGLHTPDESKIKLKYSTQSPLQSTPIIFVRLVYSIGRADLKALDDFIGTKKFLLGDKASDADAAIFGLIAQLFFHNSGPIHRFIKSESPSISILVLTLEVHIL